MVHKASRRTMICVLASMPTARSRCAIDRRRRRSNSSGGGAFQLPSVDPQDPRIGTIDACRFLGGVIVFALKHGRLVVDFLDALNTFEGTVITFPMCTNGEEFRYRSFVSKVPRASSRASALK